MAAIETERRSPTEIHVSVTVPAAEVDAAFVAAQEEVDRLRERPLGKKQLGDDPEATARNAVATRATRSLSEMAVEEALTQGGFRLSRNPEVSIESLAEQGKPFSFAFDLTVVPEFSLGDFRSLKVERPQPEAVSEEDIDALLEEIRERAADLERDCAGPLEGCDIAKLSFTSTIDGEGYEGDSAEGFAYQLGSGLLPEGFEEGLRGMEKGQEKSIAFTIPEDFANPAIAGKQAVFDVTVHELTKVRLPKVDDAFAREFGYEGLREFREALGRRISEQRAGERDAASEEAVRQALAGLLQEEVPAEMIEAQAARMLAAFKTELLQQNVRFEEYCRALGLTEEAVRLEMREEAGRLVRENLALESLYRELGLTMDQSDLQSTAAEVALDNGLSLDAPYSDMLPEQQQAIREMTEHRLATEWLLQHVLV